jgi:hypothetical protein
MVARAGEPDRDLAGTCWQAVSEKLPAIKYYNV